MLESVVSVRRSNLQRQRRDSVLKEGNCWESVGFSARGIGFGHREHDDLSTLLLPRSPGAIGEFPPKCQGIVGEGFQCRTMILG